MKCAVSDIYCAESKNIEIPADRIYQSKKKQVLMFECRIGHTQ